MADWYRRLADIPGTGYEGGARVDRRRLRGYDAQPVVSGSYVSGRPQLSWSTPSGSTSQSPAGERAFGVELKKLTLPKLLQHLEETLELPGEPADYHFAIQGVIEELWRRRREDVSVYAKIEEFSHLDLRLVEARPDFLRGGASPDASDTFVRITAFDRLMTLYEREGAWREALDVAERAARFKQVPDRRPELQERLAALDAEVAE